MTATTFSPEVKQGILWRDGNRCCMEGVRGCYGAAGAHPNHRRNRASGGSSWSGINAPSNGCAICGACNGAIESDAVLREESLRRGVKLERHQDPEATPLWSPFFRQWILCGDSATLTGLADSTLDARLASAWLPIEVVA